MPVLGLLALLASLAHGRKTRRKTLMVDAPLESLTDGKRPAFAVRPAATIVYGALVPNPSSGCLPRVLCRAQPVRLLPTNPAMMSGSAAARDRVSRATRTRETGIESESVCTCAISLGPSLNNSPATLRPLYSRRRVPLPPEQVPGLVTADIALNPDQSPSRVLVGPSNKVTAHNRL